jgi:hypothetical protein
MANVDVLEPFWPDATTQGTQRWPRNCAITPGSMDSLPTAHADYAGAILAIPGATLVRDQFAIGYKDNADAAAFGFINPMFSRYGIGLGGNFVYQSAANTLTNPATSATAIFTAAQDTFAAEASTTYLMEMYLSLTTGATSHTTSLVFGGTATLTSISYTSNAVSAAAGTLTAIQSIEGEAATAVVITAASTAVRTKVQVKGSVQINAAGTFIPQILFSADPTGTLSVNIGSYCLLVPIGSKTVVNSGERWS